jgi:hypothetical protein
MHHPEQAVNAIFDADGEVGHNTDNISLCLSRQSAEDQGGAVAAASSPPAPHTAAVAELGGESG